MKISKKDKQSVKRVQDYYRSEIAKLELPAQIQLAMRYLSLGYIPTYPAPSPGSRSPSIEDLSDLPVVEWVPMTRDDVTRYSLLLKTAMQMLGKLLPDLRSVEVTDDTSAERKLTDLELAQRIAGLLSVKEPRPTSTLVVSPSQAHSPATAPSPLSTVRPLSPSVLALIGDGNGDPEEKGWMN